MGVIGISISCLDYDLNVLARTNSSTAITDRLLNSKLQPTTNGQFPSGPGNFCFGWSRNEYATRTLGVLFSFYPTLCRDVVSQSVAVT